MDFRCKLIGGMPGGTDDDMSVSSGEGVLVERMNGLNMQWQPSGASGSGSAAAAGLLKALGGADVHENPK